MDTAEELKDVVLEMDEKEEGFYFASSISEAMVQSQQELAELNENIDSIQHLKSDADQIDYMLAASAGALSGLIDIFVVGKPGESPLGQLSDIWFENRTRDFAKLTGWSGGWTIHLQVLFVIWKINLKYRMIKRVRAMLVLKFLD